MEGTTGLSREEVELVGRLKHQLGALLAVTNDLADRGILARWETMTVETLGRASAVPRKVLSLVEVSKKYRVV